MCGFSVCYLLFLLGVWGFYWVFVVVVLFIFFLCWLLGFFIVLFWVWFFFCYFGVGFYNTIYQLEGFLLGGVFWIEIAVDSGAESVRGNITDEILKCNLDSIYFCRFILPVSVFKMHSSTILKWDPPGIVSFGGTMTLKAKPVHSVIFSGLEVRKYPWKPMIP